MPLHIGQVPASRRDNPVRERRRTVGHRGTSFEAGPATPVRTGQPIGLRRGPIGSCTRALDGGGDPILAGQLAVRGRLPSSRVRLRRQHRPGGPALAAVAQVRRAVPLIGHPVPAGRRGVALVGGGIPAVAVTVPLRTLDVPVVGIDIPVPGIDVAPPGVRVPVVGLVVTQIRCGVPLLALDVAFVGVIVALPGQRVTLPRIGVPFVGVIVAPFGVRVALPGETVAAVGGGIPLLTGPAGARPGGVSGRTGRSRRSDLALVGQLSGRLSFLGSSFGLPRVDAGRFTLH